MSVHLAHGPGPQGQTRPPGRRQGLQRRPHPQVAAPCRIGTVIPQRDDEREKHKGHPLKFDKDPTTGESIAEQFIGGLNDCRRVCTRYDKPTLNFMSMLQLAIIPRYLKIGYSNSSETRAVPTGS